MKLAKRAGAVALAWTLILTPLIFAQSTPQRATLERGYRTGYSDGYQAGVRDRNNGAARDFRDEEDYQRADRAYSPNYGSLEDYRDGYRQGFETGYEAGFDGREFDSTIPATLAQRSAEPTSNASTPEATRVNADATSSMSTATAESKRESRSATPGNAALLIPSGTVFVAELLTNLSTDASQPGDRFQARVIEPSEYAGAVLSGRVERVRRPGKVRGTAELELDFEQISLSDGRWANVKAQLIEVVPEGTSSVGKVDPEGGVRGKDSTKDDVVKVGAGAGLGALIGAVAGGGKGAAIGAAIGAAVGAGGAVASRGQDIRLQRGQRLRVRTNTDTRVQ
ncbi:MAG: hypothetical protein C4334_09030 [Pyrinomonas sp.]|uniref:hypothetical protein n=1 Tax=Pyrinomonas sp. TaxID=2080306 RepID=UPI0033327B3F